MASAVDTSHSKASPSASSAGSSKSNAVPYEANVVATGARPCKSGERELFTEETTTVLVFENGGVLRLTAAVVPGQLLFLTNKDTRREVVTQVTRKRDFKPTNCYVEVEFSEPSPGFWGVDFSAAPQPQAPVTAHQKEAAELVKSAKIISSGPAAIAPTTGEVTALKQEVEKLREQLKLLQTQSTVAENPPEPVLAPQPVPAHVAAAPAPPPAPSTISAPVVPEPPQPRHSSTSLAPSLKPPATAETDPAPHSAAMPIEPGGSFSQAPHTRKPVIRVPRELRPPKKAKGSFVPGQALRFALLAAAVLFAGFGAAWYFHWIPGLQPEPIPVSVNPAPDASANQPATSQKEPLPVASKQESASPTAANSDSSSHNAAAIDSSVSPDSSASSKRAATRPSMKTASAPVAPPSTNSATVPPKLIKSVRPVASPNSLEYFAHDKTATVTLDAIVDPSGRIKSMKVLSGPAALHHAAIEALNQYRYEPATLNGKPVAAHVTVPITFLFELTDPQPR